MEKKLLITVILFGLSFVIGLVFCFPKFQEMRVAQKELESKETELEQRKAYFEEIDILSEKLKQYPDELAVIDFALPDDFSLPFLFDFFEKIVSRNGLFLTNISQSQGSQSSPRSSRSSEKTEISDKTESGNKLKESRTSISLSGSYSAFKNFLYSMEKSARLIEVESASFSLPQDKTSTLNFNITVKTNSY
jgi:Tfp pilus assembly protein PilO